MPSWDEAMEELERMADEYKAAVYECSLFRSRAKQPRPKSVS